MNAHLTKVVFHGPMGIDDWSSNQENGKWFQQVILQRQV
jgi:hypothetical protein